jgi:hypothetical protein
MDDEFRRDREVIDAATSGPWTFENDGTVGGIVVRPPTGRPHRHDRPEDAAFIARARTRWPVALDELAQLRAELATAERERDELLTRAQRLANRFDLSQVNGDWACRECRPYSDMLKEGFVCDVHALRAWRTKGDASK